MRVLFTAPGAFGHIHPLVPIAQAIRDAGHEVRFAVPPLFAPTVERAGIRCEAAGLDRSSAPFRQLAEECDRQPIQERAAFMCRYGFAELLAREMASDLHPICQTWRPDLLVRDMTEYGGWAVAEALGIPHAVHESVAFRASRDLEIAEPLAALRAAHGLPADPELRTLERYLVLSAFPPALDGSRGLGRLTRQAYRTAPFDRSAEESAPEWPLPFPDAPLVYATLGTVINTRTDVLKQFVEGLRDEHVNLVLTVGRNGDPDQFGPQPPNVRIERYIPQSLLLPRCDLVICHGGSNTVLGSLAHGIPLVITPITADQPQNAERCAAAGAARAIPAADLSATAVREAALDVLTDPTYRRAAERIRDEIDALPGLDRMVALLEHVAAEGQLLHRPAAA